MNTLFKTIVLTCLFAIPCFAQDTEKSAGDKEAMKAEKVYAFLDEHFPGMKAELATILKEEGQIAHDAVYDQQVEIYDHYRRMLPTGKNVAMLVVEQNKMYKELEVLLDRYEALAPDDPARVKARADVEPLLAKSNTFGGEWAKQQAISMKKRGGDRYERQIAALEKKAAKMDALRAQPKKVFDDWVAYREKAFKDAAKTKKKLPENWHTDPTEAMTAAKESGKLVHVFCSATWCGPCQKMVKEVFPKEEVQDALKEFEPLYLDGDVYGAFTRKYRVRTFPTSMIINTAGEMLHRSDANGMSTSEFLEWLKTKK